MMVRIATPRFLSNLPKILVGLALLLPMTSALGAPVSGVNSVPISISIQDGGTTVLRAGDRHTFELNVQDASGGEVIPSQVVWSLQPGSDSIGYFDGSTFVSTTVGRGRIRVSVDGAVATSRTIQVMPGQLSQILLSISADQVVGHALVGTDRKSVV